MSALLDRDIDPKFRKRDISNSFTLARAEENPFTTMVKKGPKPTSSLYEWKFKTRHAPSDNAVPDGLDVQTSEYINNEANKHMIQGRVQKGRVAVRIGDIADELGTQIASGATLQADNIADAIVLCRENTELTALKNSNSQAHTDDANPMKLRGLTYTIRSTNAADSDLPIPAAALTPAGNIITGQAAATDVTEEELLGVLQSIATTCRTSKDVHVFGTPNMRRHISSFMKFTPEEAGKVLVRRFNNDAKDGELYLTVVRITCDFGTFFLHTHFSLPAGVHCLVVSMDMVQLRPVRPPSAQKLPYMGGGHTTIIEYITGLEVSNPQAHGKITT